MTYEITLSTDEKYIVPAVLYMLGCDNVLIFNRDKCKYIDYDSFPSETRIYTAPDDWCGGMYCISINALTWMCNGLSWEEYKNIHADTIMEVK